MTRCYIGLGSNLNVPRRQLVLALRSISALPHTVLKKQSKVYVTAPWGLKSQPIFCNMVAELETTLMPLNLLHHLQLIEQAQLRVRKRHWGPRTIDLDILLYGSTNIKTPALTIPHPYLLEREFVLQPLAEIRIELQNLNNSLP